MEGRALSPDMLCRDSEEPGCRGGVLPDAASGHDPDTLASKLSRRAPRDRREQRGCKEGMRAPASEAKSGAHFLPSGYKFY